MATRTAEVTIARSPDDVWEVAGDFAGIAEWMPGIEACRVDGADRLITTMGLEIRERLVRRDDATRTLAYAIVDAPLPLDAHEAEIAVVPEGAGARVTWRVTVTPDEHAELFGGIYAQSLDALRHHCEGDASGA